MQNLAPSKITLRLPFRSELEFRLLERLPAAAYLCDSEGLITYFNRHAFELWGRAPRLNDPIDRFCGSFKLFAIDGTPIRHSECWMALALRDDKEYNGHEILIERPDGSRRTALAHANPFHDEGGSMIGAVNVLMDITDQKRTEHLLRESDRRKSEFLALLAHELRNPLAPLRNGLQIMRLANNDGPIFDEARCMMERQIAQMVRLIDDLLDLSRITNGKIDLRKERIDIATVIQDAVEISRPVLDERGHELSIALPSQAVFVDVDRTRLAQVFANLLNNSAKYTPQGGFVRLLVERQGSDVVISVKDNGIGIPTAMLPKIFDMFIQVDRTTQQAQEGLGIGLNLVRGIVDMHGGRVEAISDGEGLGSEFIVRLSVALPPLDDSTADDQKKSELGVSRYRILVVDDNKDAAMSLAMMLKIMGHETRTAYDGTEALEVAGSFRPELLLLDLGLPKLNGYDVCRQIRQQAWGTHLVIIALSGWGQEDDKRRSKEAGFNFHMVKPVDPAALEKLLAGLLLTPN